MASQLSYSQTSSWANENQHVDLSVTDGTQFINAAHIIIYAAVTGSANATFQPVGVVQGWSFTEQRQIEEVWELGSDVKYLVPGRTTGQIAITRMLINGPDLINVLYGTFTGASSSTPGTEKTAICSLRDINLPVDIMFVSYNNDEESTDNEVRYFTNCWVAARQESITANQVVIAENCTITYEMIDSTKFNISTPATA